MEPADRVIARFVVRLQWALVLGAIAWLVWRLGPILTPFVLAALLAWMGDPVVDRLEAAGHSRNAAVALVFTVMSLVLVLALVILVPMITAQVRTLGESLPGYREWVLQTAQPWLEARTGIDIDAWLDPARIMEARARLQQVAADLASLPERTRRILLKRRLENMSYAKIAEAEDMTVAAVEKTVARATLRLMRTRTPS